MTREEERFQKRIRELADTAYQRGIVLFTDFLNLNELHMVHSLPARDTGISVRTGGGYDSAERQIAAFVPDAFSFEWNYPIACLHIEARSAKFAEKLSHRDYLGSVLGLGVERSVLGDILVEEKGAYLFCLERMAGFLAENLCSVRHTPVTVSVVDDPGEIPGPHLVPVSGTVASCRLDCLIALAFRASRSSIVPLIEGGQVFVNGKMVTSNGYAPAEGDIVSVRKMGRFLFAETGNMTRKGRCQVLLQRYQ